MPSTGVPSESLLGPVLDGGWHVTEQISKTPHATGGRFSTGYKVVNGAKTAYLKALDFSAAFSSSDVPRELQVLSEAYNFERDLCYKCKAIDIRQGSSSTFRWVCGCTGISAVRL